MARRISKARSNAIKHGYRSGFEHKVADQLKESKTKFEYETTVINYIKPETQHKYFYYITTNEKCKISTTIRVCFIKRRPQPQAKWNLI